MKRVRFKARVEPCAAEEAHRAWVRISEELRGGIPSGAYVALFANQRKILCQVRGTPGETGTVKISEWYRNALGWNEPPSGEVDMAIKSVGFVDKLLSFSMHPDDVVRTGMGLALISVGLGILSLGIALLPPSIRVAVGSNDINTIFGWASLVVDVIAIPLGAILIGLGIRLLIGHLPKTA